MSSLVLALLISGFLANARTITWVITQPGVTNEVYVEAYEVLKIVSGDSWAGGGRIILFKDGARIEVYEAKNFSPRSDYAGRPLVMSGPATLRLWSHPLDTGISNAPSFLTFEITPDPYPPDRSIVIGPGPGGAVVTLESSTNLTQWMASTNGVYTNLTEAMFSRIKADRIR